jgi:hypothetical protein
MNQISKWDPQATSMTDVSCSRAQHITYTILIQSISITDAGSAYDIPIYSDETILVQLATLPSSQLHYAIIGIHSHLELFILL